jgi:hypothetical protein
MMWSEIAFHAKAIELLTEAHQELDHYVNEETK